MTTTTEPVPGRHPGVVPGLATIVGFLVCVEIASGILQGFYTPIFSDIADHLSIQDADVNWFEAAQLVVSALVVPVLARLGDLIGHKQVLLISTAVTALASWALAFAPTFTLFLIAVSRKLGRARTSNTMATARVIITSISVNPPVKAREAKLECVRRCVMASP